MPSTDMFTFASNSRIWFSKPMYGLSVKEFFQAASQAMSHPEDTVTIKGIDYHGKDLVRPKEGKTAEAQKFYAGGFLNRAKFWFHKHLWAPKTTFVDNAKKLRKVPKAYFLNPIPELDLKTAQDVQSVREELSMATRIKQIIAIVSRSYNSEKSQQFDEMSPVATALIKHLENNRDKLAQQAKAKNMPETDFLANYFAERIEQLQKATEKKNQKAPSLFNMLWLGWLFTDIVANIDILNAV